MEKTTTNSNSNSNLKAIIIVLALLLVGSLAYIFTLTTDVETTQASLASAKTEKEAIMKDLETLKATYDAAIAENTTMSADLVAERDKVVALMADLKKAKGNGNSASLKKYKDELAALDTKMKEMMLENEGLKKLNSKIIAQRDSTGVVLSQSRNQNQELAGQNEELARTVEKGAKLNVINLKAVAFKQKKSGKQILTEKAGSADVLKISFTIAANPIAKTGDKEYYVQIIDATNAILGDKKLATFEGGKTLEYSFIANVKYENQSVDVSQDIAGSKFAKGTYFVNLFDKGDMVSTSSVTLK